VLATRALLVGDILSSINDFLSGGFSDLGDAVSGIASGT
jgi:hypothetical protein